jgi:hypothetical protein
LELSDAVSDIGDRSVQRLALFNFRQLSRFTSIAIVQGRTSYLVGLAAAGMAFIVLLSGAVVTLTFPNSGIQIASGALTAAGAALSSFVSFIFLRTYRMTTQQMSYYYGQPLVHCYLLHAERIALRYKRDCGEGHAWEATQTLIGAALAAGLAAQHQLLDLQKEKSRPSNHEQSTLRTPVSPVSKDVSPSHGDLAATG